MCIPANEFDFNMSDAEKIIPGYNKLLRKDM